MSRYGDRPEQVERRSRESQHNHGAHCLCVTCKPEPLPRRR